MENQPTFGEPEHENAKHDVIHSLKRWIKVCREKYYATKNRFEKNIKKMSC